MLVGFRITVRLLSDLGVVPIGIAAVELVVVMVVLRWVAVRWFRIDEELALLVAAGSAICGAAAILCVAALTRAREQNAGIAIALITLAGTLALLVYPVAFAAGLMPAFDDRLYGIFVGSSIYELAQVYGASFAVSEGALNTATLVKLCKVLMLLPMLLALSAWRRRGSDAAPCRAAALSLVRHRLHRRDAVQLVDHAASAGPARDPRLRPVPVHDGDGRARPEHASVEAGRGRRRLAPAGVGAVGLALSSSVAFALVSPLAQRSAAAAPARPKARCCRASAGARSRRWAAPSATCRRCAAATAARSPLYSDLLLHDMGGRSTTRSCRATPPAPSGGPRRWSRCACGNATCTTAAPPRCAMP